MPPLLFSTRELYTFKISYYNKSRECLKVVKISLGPLPNLKITGLARKVFRKEKLSSSRIYCCYVALVQSLNCIYIALVQSLN